MADDKEIDFNFRGLRIRSMEWLPADAMMICDANNQPKAIYSADKGWRAVDEDALREAHTLILSVDITAEIARRVGPLQAEAEKDKP
jgi:hypothetical protein